MPRHTTIAKQIVISTRHLGANQLHIFMGALRLLLALAVITAHTPMGEMATGGPLSVETFFIISGFYMALLLENKRYPTTKAFYAARFWRLWPLFIGVVLASAAFRDPIWRQAIALQSPIIQGLSALAHSTMLGLDALFALEYYGPATTLTTALPGHTGHFLLLIPQSWSLSLEVLFVLLAPFLTRLTTRTLAVILGLSQLAWLAAQLAGYTDSFWAYRFFPFESGLFIAGMLGYRLLQSAAPQTVAQRAPYAILLFPAAATALLWGFSPTTLHIIFLTGAAIAIPFLFHLTQSNRLDRLLGELSYPVYLWHWLVFANLTLRLAPMSPLATTLATVGITLILSIISYICIQRPVDVWRHRWARTTGVSQKTAGMSQNPL